MQALERVLQSVKNRRFDDDFVDRANYVFTPVMLASFAITVAAKQYVGQPLQCWVPAHFTGTWESYSESYCFVENTYYVAMTERFPTTVTDREKRQLHYYQWVPFILAAQLLLFFLPKMMWHTFNWKTGINMNALCVAARPVKKKDHKHTLKAEMNTDVRQAVQHLSTALQYQQRKQRSATSTRSHQGGGRGTAASRIAHRNAMNDGFSMSYDDFPPKANNNVNNSSNLHHHVSASVAEATDAEVTLTQSSVTYYYLAFKALNLSVAVFELFLLNRSLGAADYCWWGWGVLGDLLNNRQWHQSGHFPRVTFCDVTVREQGGHHVPHTLQCVLMLNMFNEKIFIFVWFWLLLLAVVDAVNLVYWAFGSLNARSAIRFIKSHLSASIDDADVSAFVRDALGRDGVTALRLIAHNCGDLAANLIVESVWKSHWASASAQLTAAISDAMHQHRPEQTTQSPPQLKAVPTHQRDAAAQALEAHRQLRARLTELARKRSAEQQQVEQQLAEKLRQQQQELTRKQQQRESIFSVGSDGYGSGAGYYSSGGDGHQQAGPLPPKQQHQDEMSAVDGNNNNNNGDAYNNKNNIIAGGGNLFSDGAATVTETTTTVNHNNNGGGGTTVMGDDTLYFDEEADLRLVGDRLTNRPPTAANAAAVAPSAPMSGEERIGEVRYLA